MATGFWLSTTLQRLLLVSFKPSAAWFAPSPFTSPSPISALLEESLESDLQFTLLPPSDVLLTQELADTLRTSDTGTDLRVDWTDACSLGFDGE